MSGFMAGFGSAFAQSFQAGKERKARQEEDKFRYQWQDYIDRRKDRDEWRKTSAKNVSKAKLLTEEYGQPAEAWTQVLKKINAGYTDEDIRQSFENGGRYEIDNSEGESSTEKQMQDSGMTPAGPSTVSPPQGPATPAEPASPMGAATDDFAAKVSGITGETPDEVKSVFSREEDPTVDSNQIKMKWTSGKKATDLTKVDTVEGAQALVTETEFQVQQGNASPEELTRAQAHLTAQKLLADEEVTRTQRAKAIVDKETYVTSRAKIFDENGKVVETAPVREVKGQPGVYRNLKTGGLIQGDVEFYTKAQDDDWDAVVKEYSKPVQEYITKVTSLSDSAQLTDELRTIALETPQALTYAGTLAEITDQVVRDTVGVVDLAKSILTDGKDPTKELTPEQLSGMAAAEQKMKDQLNSGQLDYNSRLAVAKALMDSKIIRLAYARAASQGQSGRSVAVNEFQMFQNDVKANGNIQAFLQGNMEFLLSQKANLSNEGGLIENYNTGVTNFFAKNGFNGGDLIPSIDELLGDRGELFNPELASPSYKKKQELNQPKQGQVNPAADEGVPPEYKYSGKVDADTGAKIYVGPDGEEVTFD